MSKKLFISDTNLNKCSRNTLSKLTECENINELRQYQVDRYVDHDTKEVI